MNKKRDLNNTDADIEVDNNLHAYDKEDKIVDPEGDTTNMEEEGANSTTHDENAEKQDNNGEGSKLVNANINDKNAEIQDTDGDGNEVPNYETPDTLLQMLAILPEIPVPYLSPVSLVEGVNFIFSQLQIWKIEQNNG